MSREATAPDFRRTANSSFALSLAVLQPAGAPARLSDNGDCPTAQRVPPMIAVWRELRLQHGRSRRTPFRHSL